MLSNTAMNGDEISDNTIFDGEPYVIKNNVERKTALKF
jgi:hypothetical protein